MPMPAAAAPRMILSSMSVMFMTQRTGMAAPAEVAHEQVGEQEGPEVADVRRAVDGRAARVDPDDVRRAAARAAGSRRSACRAAGSSLIERASIVASASVEIERPAPSEPSRLPVDALTLTASGVETEGRRDRRRASPRGARRGAAGARRSSGRRRPAASRRRRGAPRPRPAARALSTPRGVEASAGNNRPRSPSPAAPSSASATRMQDDVAVRVAMQPRGAGDLDAAQAQRLARPERMRVVPDPGPSARDGSGEQVGDASEVGGHGHLEIGGIAGNDMDGDSTGLQEGGLVGPRPAGASGAAERRCAGGRVGRPAGSAPSPSPDRSTVAATRSPSTRFRVSATGTTGIAAPCAGRRLDDGRDQASGTRPAARRRGRARPDRRPDRGATRSSASNPARDRVLRRLRRRRRTSRPGPSGSHGPSSSSRRRSSDVTTTIDATSGAAASAASVWASSGRPPMRRAQLVGAAHPRRRRRRPPRRSRRRGRRSVAISPLNRAAAGRRSSGRPRSGGRA